MTKIVVQLVDGQTLYLEHNPFNDVEAVKRSVKAHLSQPLWETVAVNGDPVIINPRHVTNIRFIGGTL